MNKYNTSTVLIYSTGSLLISLYIIIRKVGNSLSVALEFSVKHVTNSRRSVKRFR